MVNVELSGLVVISRMAGLRRLVDTLRQEPAVAVDTESNSLYAYREQVCLIQFSTRVEDFLVDPLLLDDLGPLGAIFEDRGIEKVFHAAEYDLITLKRDFGYQFENLFDTMVAARILGWEELGLGAVLRAEFGLEVDKRHQRANWGRRPLPPEMLAYARMDTHYLLELRERMKAELEASGRWALAQEDFQRLRHVNGKASEEGVEAMWRISGSYDLNGQQAAVLRELVQYRDKVARASNQPLFKVLGDRTLLGIALELPQDGEALERAGRLNARLMSRHGEGLLRAVRRGLAVEPVYPPRAARPDEQYLARLEALKSWRKEKGLILGVASDVVLPRDLMHAIAAQRPRRREELAQVLKEAPYRLEQFGDEILHTIGS